MNDEGMKAFAEAAYERRLRDNGSVTTHPRWTFFARGRVYRPVMKLMHRLGWCYPRPTLMDNRSVWCHWCGMRGKR